MLLLFRLLGCGSCYRRCLFGLDPCLPLQPAGSPAKRIVLLTLCLARPALGLSARTLRSPYVALELEDHSHLRRREQCAVTIEFFCHHPPPAGVRLAPRDGSGILKGTLLVRNQVTKLIAPLAG